MQATVVVDRVRETWCTSLGLETATDEDNFFTLGGNSLSAIEFKERIDSLLSIEFPIQVLFLNGDLGDIIEECVRLHADDGTSVTPG
jgi:acyl carrier protein